MSTLAGRQVVDQQVEGKRVAGERAGDHRAGGRPEGGRATGCGYVRERLCRLAADGGWDRDALAVARHVSSCVPCDRFVDGLAALRGWLGAESVPLPADGEDEQLLRQAAQALATELKARLARDLLGRARGEAVRARVDMEADLRRLEVLRSSARISGVRFDRLARLLLGRGEPPARMALGAAARLDPTGLDLALAWLGQLTRDGRGDRAQRLADRYLVALS